jgi:hypothetical protein
MDIDGSEMILAELLDRYFFSKTHHTSCSVIENKYYNNVIEEISIVEEESEARGEDGITESPSYDSENRFIDHSKDTISSSKSCSRYRYTTPQQIEQFFASDNGPEEDHNLGESICKPLIGQHNHKPFFYYCKEHPNIENIYLKSIEDHIRLKDSEYHKAELLEMIQGEQIDKHENKNRQDITIRN